MTNTPRDLALAMMAAHATHEDGWVDRYYHPDCEWIEHPINGVTKGRRGGIEALRKADAKSRATFASLEIISTNALEDGDRVALEIDFSGILIGAEAGTAPTRLNMAVFLTFKDGLIIRQVDFLIPQPPET